MIDPAGPASRRRPGWLSACAAALLVVSSGTGGPASASERPGDTAMAQGGRNSPSLHASAAKATRQRIGAVQKEFAAAVRDAVRAGASRDAAAVRLESARGTARSAEAELMTAGATRHAAVRETLAAEPDRAASARRLVRRDHSRAIADRRAAVRALGTAERVVDAEQGRLRDLQDALLQLRAEQLWTSAATATAAPPAGTPGSVRSVIEYALAQIGKPYLWGAAGPDAFDCSGLTQQAWLAGGVLLAHNSATQAQQLPALPLEELRPGDLVFYATDPTDLTTVHHVGLYVGSDLMVEAPRPGTPVRLATIWRPGLAGAARP